MRPDRSRVKQSIGHPLIDFGYHLAVHLEPRHDPRRLGIGDPALVDVVNQCPDEPKQLGVLRSVSIPHQEVPDLETGWTAA